MFFFRNNNDTSSSMKTDGLDFHKFFSSREKEDILMLTKEVSNPAKTFFESSVSSLVGQVPNELADVSITMNKDALSHLLFSAMLTGYMTKSVENKLELEMLINQNEKEIAAERTLDVEDLF
jgi:predicted alpha/beta-fold hydrolase